MLVNPEPLRYPGVSPTTGGTSLATGADTTSATSWVQQQPWYRSTLAQWGNPQTLSLGQRGYLARTAQQAGLDPSFGFDTNGTVEDWSTPTAAKIGLAAFGAAAGGAALGAFGTPAASATSATAATGAPMTAGAGAAMTPAAAGAGWFSPSTLGNIIGGGLGLIGNLAQSSANRDAANLQHQSTEEALADARAQRAWQQGQYANYLQRLQPFNQFGQQAASQLASFLSRSPYNTRAGAKPPLGTTY